MHPITKFGSIQSGEKKRSEALTIGMTIDTEQTDLVEQLPIDLPFDRRRVPEKKLEGIDTFAFDLPPRLTQTLAQLANEHGLRHQSLYLAAFGILLSRYSSVEQLKIHAVIALAGSDPLQAASGDSRPAVTVEASYAKDRTLKAVFQDIDRELSEPSGKSESGVGEPCHAGFDWKEVQPIDKAVFKSSPIATNPFDLSLRIRSREATVLPALVYRPELFDRETVARMSRHLVHLLHAMTGGVETSIASVDMMPDEEKALVLGIYSGHEAPYPKACLHELFLEQVKLRPEAEAVVYGEERLSYEELDKRSNQVAQYLLLQGLSAEECVGIFMDRSVDMIIGMLGTLKAGGAYVPIDPDYPAERLSFIADDTALRFVLTQKSVKSVLPSAASSIFLDSEDSPVLDCSTEAVPNRVNPESIAVVIYTSGSTGKPKAARIPHRAVVRTVRNTNYLEATPADRVAQATSPSFDAAIKEIWMALVNGAALVGLSRETLIVPAEARKFIQKEKITLLVVNTAYVHQIALEAPDAFKDVRKVVFGGEAAEAGPLRELVKHIGPGILINGYGPAEGCVITTFFEINEIPEEATSVPIGRPVSNARVYLLDDQQRPVPIGVPGEICIGGEGVARGYLNRPELTAQRFLPDPFSHHSERFLYRTGDLARMRGNGELEFLGRRDEQVKIRGHRIELAEVREAISAHSAVKQVFLTIRQEQAGDKRLVAYVILRQALANAAQALRKHAREKLPDHMVPSAFVVVESVPLTTNGKIDWKALPAPSDQVELENYQAPTAELEVSLTAVWQVVLRAKRVGVNDSFFDLGGHSLLAARLVAEIEKATGHNIPVATLFEAPTIAQLATRIAERTYNSAWSPCVTLQAAADGATNEPFFCIHSLGANLVSVRKIASLMRNDRAFYGLQPHGLDGQQAPLDTIEAMATAYLKEIRKVQPNGPYYLGGICLGGVIAFEMAQQLKRAGEHVASVVLIDSFLPGPLKYIHARAGSAEYVDRHIGNMLSQPGIESLKYLATLAQNGVKHLRRIVAGNNQSSIVQATKSIRAAHINAFLSYRPQAYSGKLVQLLCAESSQRGYEDRRMAWAYLVPTGGFELRLVPGDHLTMVEEPHVRQVAQELQSTLDHAFMERRRHARSAAFRNTVRRRLSA
jgi:amino acid adenylation domain-containing protein